MEYAIGDPQVKVLLNYLCGDHFKQNLAEMEDSDEFQNVNKNYSFFQHLCDS